MEREEKAEKPGRVNKTSAGEERDGLGIQCRHRAPHGSRNSLPNTDCHPAKGKPKKRRSRNRSLSYRLLTDWLPSHAAIT